MQTKIPHKNTSLSASVFGNKNNKKCLLLLCGGNLDIGRERFLTWQEDLEKAGVSSVTFDYLGIPGTRDTVKESSLRSRMSEVETVLNWIESELNPADIILYGVSMGGYIALSVASNKPNLISGLVLHAPAAYASAVHEQPFDSTFTKIIRQTQNWDDSLSFVWLEQYEKPILFLQPEHDEVIPAKITKRYLNIGNNKPSFNNVLLRKASHKCWGTDENDLKVQRKILTQLHGFLKDTGHLNDHSV
jgi:pimeloyl-ACP methyl ester carboxylesterase